MNKKYNKMASDLAKAGRYGDDQVIHVSSSEVEGLGSLLPSGKLPTNPETGQPEAFVITLPLLLTGLAAGAATGGIAGGVTAKSRGIPLWEGILTGAGKGAATGLVTAGIGGALTPGADVAATGLETAALDAATQGTIVDQAITAGVDPLLEQGLATAANPAMSSVESALSFVPEVPVGGAVEGPVSFVDPSVGLTQPLVTPGPGPLAPSEMVNPLEQFTSLDLPPVDVAGNEVAREVAGNEAWNHLGEAADVIELGEAADVIELGEVVGTEAPGMVQGVLGENNTEYLNWLLDNPQLAMAPGMVELATGRSEWDEETYPEYDGPDPSWTTGPGTAESPSWSSSISSGSASSPSWAAKDGGPVVKRESDSKYDSNALGRMKSLIRMLDRVGNPTIPGRYNPLSDEDIRMKIRPNMPGGMQRGGVTLPFRQGGLASNNPRSGGLGSLRRP